MPATTVVTPWKHDDVRVGLEGELRVVVGVGVDDAGRDHQAVGVELAGAAALDEADLDDPAVLDRHVGPPPGQAGAVDDDPVADHQVVGRHWASN